ncbi:MAG: tRNA-dihydrouridine synthase [Candidatus Paceibacterota bacterium]|jgi:nifR3 family TIM-barrel protein
MKNCQPTKNFWLDLTKPFFALAPMYDVTDAAFRAMFVRHSKSRAKSDLATRDTTSHDLVLFTEFVSADGLASEAGRLKLRRELYYTEAERPIVAQIFGSKLESIEQAIKLVKELGFDGVDINMGCPDRAVEKQGAGAALIKNPKLAREIIAAAKKAAGKMPVSVKTRIGYNKIDFDWIQTILDAKPDAVTFHLRTRKEMSDVPAHYEVVPEIVRIFKSSGIPIIINGDVKSVEEGQELVKKYSIDGVMIGRGAFGKPWVFAKDAVRSRISGSLEKRLRMAVEHSKLFWDLYGDTQTNQKLFNGHTKNFAVMRKHFKAYASGFKGATALRAKLMQANNPDEVEKIIDEFLLD